MITRRDYVQSVYEPIVQEMLANVKEVEEKGKYVFDSKEKNKTIEVEYLANTPTGAKALRAKIYDKENKEDTEHRNVVDIIITYAPNLQQDEDHHPLSHILEKSRWSKALLKRYEEMYGGNKEARVYFPTPLGFGDDTPRTHHWSEYVGKKLALHLADNTANINNITAKLASALTAKEETIESILKGKHQTNERRIDALTFDNPNPKHVLSYYLSDAQIRLEKALKKYEQVQKEAKNISFISRANEGIKKIEKQKKDLQTLKENFEEKQFEYDSKDYVLIHSDLTSLDNILIDEQNEIWFIDGIIVEREGEQCVLDNFVGPKQIYYYIFKEQLKEHKESGSTPFYQAKDTSKTYDTNFTKLLENLEKILNIDFEIDTENKENNEFIGKIISAYFEAGKTRKEAIALYNELLPQNARQAKKTTDNNNQQKLIEESAQAGRTDSNSPGEKEQGPPAEPKPNEPPTSVSEADKQENI